MKIKTYATTWMGLETMSSEKYNHNDYILILIQKSSKQANLETENRIDCWKLEDLEENWKETKGIWFLHENVLKLFYEYTKYTYYEYTKALYTFEGELYGRLIIFLWSYYEKEFYHRKEQGYLQQYHFFWRRDIPQGFWVYNLGSLLEGLRVRMPAMEPRSDHVQDK